MSGKHIVIIDYEMGNKHSIANALKFLGYQPTITKDAAKILSADGLILPGVGSFNEAMGNIETLQLKEAILDAVEQKKIPIFGICLGMQIMAKEGVEGGLSRGLGLIDATVVPLNNLHVGFNSIEILQHNPIFTTISDDTHFYFDHAYHMHIDDTYVSAKTLFNNTLVVASIQHRHIFATQFHPEKSQKWGLVLLRNFLNFVEHHHG